MMRWDNFDINTWTLVLGEWLGSADKRLGYSKPDLTQPILEYVRDLSLYKGMLVFAVG